MSVIFGIKENNRIIIAGDKRGSSIDGKTLSDDLDKVLMINDHLAFSSAGNAAIEKAISIDLNKATNKDCLTTDDLLDIIKAFYKRVADTNCDAILALPFYFLIAGKGRDGNARDKNITITFDCGQTFEALLDFNWTAEAVTNVLDNAVKYTPSRGVVDLKITEYPSYLRLDVSDNGIGIPEEEQAKIFGRFYRGKQSAGVDGVGIGLYLTRDIVNKQNGYIKVASDEKGTIFSLFLKKV